MPFLRVRVPFYLPVGGTRQIHSNLLSVCHLFAEPSAVCFKPHQERKVGHKVVENIQTQVNVLVRPHTGITFYFPAPQLVPDFPSSNQREEKVWRNLRRPLVVLKCLFERCQLSVLPNLYSSGVPESTTRSSLLRRFTSFLSRCDWLERPR